MFRIPSTHATLDRFRKDDANSKTTRMSSFGANCRQLLVCDVVLDDFTTWKFALSQIYAWNRLCHRFMKYVTDLRNVTDLCFFWKQYESKMLVMLLWVYIHTGQAWKICLTRWESNLRLHYTNTSTLRVRVHYEYITPTQKNHEYESMHHNYHPILFPMMYCLMILVKYFFIDKVVFLVLH
jgi:hypothetical protein